jgi:hypothetical protein
MIILFTLVKAVLLLLSIFMSFQVIGVLVFASSTLKIDGKDIARFWTCAVFWSSFYFISNL